MSHRPAIAAEIEAIRAEIAQAKAAQGNQAASDEDYWELVTKMALMAPEQWAGMPAPDMRRSAGGLARRAVIEGR